MALYAFDGTGNDDQDRDDRDSNVIDFFGAYIDPTKHTDPDLELGSLYMKGIGTPARTFIGRGPAEAFAIGGHDDRVTSSTRTSRGTSSPATACTASSSSGPASPAVRTTIRRSRSSASTTS